MSLRIFDGAVVIMTGGASGIGKAMAAELLKRGAEIVLADRDAALAQQTAELLGPKARAAEVDVSHAGAVERVVDETVDRSGRLDFFFNNAGIGYGGDVAKIDLGAWNKVMDVNLRGVAHGVFAAYPRMVDQGFGHIVNTASMAGLIPTPMMVSYGTTKHAVVGLTTSLRLEAERHGVRVSALCPGVIRTPILTGGKYGGMAEDVPEEKRIAAWERVRPMDPTVFARRAIDAVARNEALIILPSWYRAIWWLNRLSPSLGMSLARRMYADMKRTIGSE